MMWYIIECWKCRNFSCPYLRMNVPCKQIEAMYAGSIMHKEAEKYLKEPKEDWVYMCNRNPDRDCIGKVIKIIDNDRDLDAFINSLDYESDLQNRM